MENQCGPWAVSFIANPSVFYWWEETLEQAPGFQVKHSHQRWGNLFVAQLLYMVPESEHAVHQPDVAHAVYPYCRVVGCTVLPSLLADGHRDAPSGHGFALHRWSHIS
ncbi:hypothetical protein ACNKHQ_18475 [Shigella flexneri]